MKSTVDCIGGGSPQTAWQSALAHAGFAPVADNLHRCDGVDLQRGSDGWATLWRREPHDGAALQGHLGQAGPWKAVEDKGALRRICDLPLDDGADPHASAAMLRWAVETSRGEFDLRGWQPPPGHEISEALGHGKLEVQVADQVRRGTCIVEESRLALRLPLMTSIDPDLSPQRRSRLEHLLNQAQSKWRMVRIGMDGGADAQVIAEIDLTGCPHEMLCGGGLLKSARDCLVACVNWIVYPATVVADTAVGSVLLDGPQNVPVPLFQGAVL